MKLICCKKWLLFTFLSLMFCCCNTYRHVTFDPFMTEKEENDFADFYSFNTTTVVGIGGDLAVAEKLRVKNNKIKDAFNALDTTTGKVLTFDLDTVNVDSLTIHATAYSDILFAFNSFMLSDTAIMFLNSFADIIQQQMPQADLLIVGHTDNIGAKDYNLDLSQNRAKAVSLFLQHKGINNIRTEGRGFAEPIRTNNTDEGRRQNRRVEIFIKPNL